jgi:hypothetical protein
MTEMITLLKLTIFLCKGFEISLSSFLARSENTSQQLRQTWQRWQPKTARA